MRILEYSIDKVKEIPLYEVVSSFVSLKRKGKEFVGLCPFHEDHKPSFTVVPEKNIYKCHSCGEGGAGGIDFVMKHEKVEFKEAVKWIAGKFGIILDYEEKPVDPDYKKKKEEEKAKKEILSAILNQARDKYKEQFTALTQDHAAHKELYEKRRYTQDTLTTFEIGFSPDAWDFLTKHLIEKGLQQEGLESGLVRVSESKGTTYDFFRNRIMFPIHDAQGSVIAFGGRTLGEVSDMNPKYLNSPESLLYDKSKTLYGFHIAKKTIQKTRSAIIVEGYADVISFHQAGLTQTLGSCGTALTEDQVKLLKSVGVTTIDLCFDADENGKAAALRAIDIVIAQGLACNVINLPDEKGEDGKILIKDPDDLARKEGANVSKYIADNRIDGIVLKANNLLQDETNPIVKDTKFREIAAIIALIEAQTARDYYIKRIANDHFSRFQTIEKMVNDVRTQKSLAKSIKEFHQVQKNQVVSLNGHTKTWDFFQEITFKKGGGLKALKVDKNKLVKLFHSFGFCRHDLSPQTSTFIMVEDNMIREVSTNKIIDRFEDYVRKEYDFESAGCEYTNAETLLSKMYDGLGQYFSDKLLQRVRLNGPLIINKDKQDKIYFYYKNGFVEVTANGYKLRDYAEMPGSVWADQTLDRNFEYFDVTEAELGPDVYDMGYFAHFVWRISGSEMTETMDRFISLCSIIGYLVHDFYDAELRAILLTDSNLSDEANGRSGKTMLAKMLGYVRSYSEINGKDFDANNKNKYELVTPGTQIVHLNDVQSTGRTKFQFEAVFNDVTEGMMVNAKYRDPFRHRAKMIISSNKTINIQGGSERARVIEFELSQHFSENWKPEQEYGHWFGRDWTQEEWVKFDNFICYCANVYLKHKISIPKSINLEERKLRDHTASEFIEFMDDIKANLLNAGHPYTGYYLNDSEKPVNMPAKDVEMSTFEFDKRKLYDKFIADYPDFAKLKQNTFTKWLKMFGQMRYGVTPMEDRRNSKNYIQFITKQWNLN